MCDRSAGAHLPADSNEVDYRATLRPLAAVHRSANSSVHSVRIARAIEEPGPLLEFTALAKDGLAGSCEREPLMLGTADIHREPGQRRCGLSKTCRRRGAASAAPFPYHFCNADIVRLPDDTRIINKTITYDVSTGRNSRNSVYLYRYTSM